MLGPTELFQVKNFTVAHTPFDGPIVDARVVVNAGSGNEAADQWGTAHFLEHMFFKGTEKKDYKEVNKIAARLGYNNAHTSNHLTAFLLQFLPKDLAEGLDLLMEMTFQPALPEDEATKETGVIVEECQMYLDNPQAFFWNTAEQHLLGDQHGHPIIGTRESIEATTVQKMRQFLGDFYTPGNILISVVGDISQHDVVTALEKCLPDIPDSPRTERWQPEFNFDDFAFYHKSKQAVLGMVAKGLTTEEVIAGKCAVEVFRTALGGGMHSLLFDRLREELGLCYSVSAGHWEHGNFGLLGIFTFLDEKNIQLATDEIQKIVAHVREKGFTDEMLEISKTHHLFGWAKVLQTSVGVNSMLEDYFDLDNTHLGEYISLDARQKAIEGLTNDDMIEVARLLLDKDSPVKTCQMTEEEPEKQLAPMKDEPLPDHLL
jgi:predicted Zn-dependent peptidase